MCHDELEDFIAEKQKMGEMNIKKTSKYCDDT
jgi:hypothetical protein